MPVSLLIRRICHSTVLGCISVLLCYCYGHGRQQGGEASPPRIFKHGSNVVDKGLKVLFFGLFFAIFWSFFPLAPHGRGK